MKTKSKVLRTQGILSLCALIGLFPLSTPHAQQRDSSVTVKIINGNDAPQGGYPWMVALLRTNEADSTEAHFCGGTLIGPQHILTAAHCVQLLRDPTDIQVSIGERSLPYDRGIRGDIVGYKIHPLYNEVTLENDMAIIKLTKPVSNQPIALAQASDAALYEAGRDAMILGWGIMDPALPILPTTLQEAQVPIQSDSTCSEELGRYYKPQSMLCAGIKSSSSETGDGVDSCNGDSGGPLIIFDDSGVPKQVGITSWGFGKCANEKVRGVYSEIPANEAFAFSFPDAPPMPKSFPVISYADSAMGSAEGTTVTCSPGAYFGDPVTAYSYQWYSDSAASVRIIGANSSTYRLSAIEPNRFLVCSVIASNAGGNSEEVFSEAAWIPEPNVSPEPEPTPTPSQQTADTEAPTLSIKQIVCEGRRCSALIEAEDAESGISTLSAVVELKYQGRCSKSRRCSKGRNKQLSLKSLGRGFWSVSFRGYPRPKQRAKLIVSATDRAGNTKKAEFTKRVPTR